MSLLYHAFGLRMLSLFFSLFFFLFFSCHTCSLGLFSSL
uniref:Uncharacterized protein n=1 Tax=Anguilla anguilla TaxID=7936 RepID=A0A0E9XFC1_ANGAN